MDMPLAQIQAILKSWFGTADLASIEVEAMTSGLSGALLWRVTAENMCYCLRRWPRAHPSADELAAIHGLITHVWNGGLQDVPLTRKTLDDKTFATVDGHLWELAQWLPGETFSKLTPFQIVSAMEALARFHKIAATYGQSKTGIAPGLQKRVDLLKQLEEGQPAQLEKTINSAPSSPLRELALEMLSCMRQGFAEAMHIVQGSASVSVPLQWCLRDVHKGNLLFTSEEVSGLVDFGAAAIDSVAGDIARLVGSIAGNDLQMWQECIAAYAEHHTLTAEELLAIPAYDRGGVLVAAANWLRWLFVEQKQFADAATTQVRLTELAERLQGFANPTNPFVLGPKRQENI